MTTEPPQPRTSVTTASLSRAQDMGYLAMADVARVTAAIGADYRLVGGHMVSHLVYAYEVTGVPERETADADLGADAKVIASPELLTRLIGLGYWQEAGNRFERNLATDEVAAGDDPNALPRPTIDVLAPSGTSAHRPNQPYGDLVVDEIPGLRLALAAEATVLSVDTRLTTGQELLVTVPLPSPKAALVLKVLAFDSRHATKDVIDIWRLLEVCRVAGLTPADWRSTGAQGNAVKVLRQLVRPGSNALRAAIRDSGTRVRVTAIARAVVG